MLKRTNRQFKVSALSLMIVGLGWLTLSLPAGATPPQEAGAHPVDWPPMTRKTQGWHDIYLTHNRICRQCQMTDLGGERVQLLNQKGVAGIYPSYQIIGVDYHPRQRKFLEHMARNNNLPAMKTLLPHYFPHNWDGEHGHQADYYRGL